MLLVRRFLAATRSQQRGAVTIVVRRQRVTRKVIFFNAGRSLETSLSAQALRRRSYSLAAPQLHPRLRRVACLSLPVKAPWAPLRAAALVTSRVRATRTGSRWRAVYGRAQRPRFLGRHWALWRLLPSTPSHLSRAAR